MPLFPLADTILLPHAVLPLHIVEAPYRQMIDDALDATGQIAVATAAKKGRGNQAKETKGGVRRRGDLRPIACIGQIIQHEGLPDGRHNILLHGVCRARILDVDEPSGGRGYRVADLAPIEVYEEAPPSLTEVRTRLKTLLSRPRLKRMRSVDAVIEWFDRPDIPTHALLELIGFTLIKNNEVKYRLLAEPDPKRRAAVIRQELIGIDHLVSRAERQGHDGWPKGMSWN